jgi:hypothetical protein
VFRNAVGLPVAALLAAVLGLGALGADLGWFRLAVAASPGERAIDGTIGSGEYAHQYPAADIGMTVFWTVEDDEIRLAAEAPATGWVAVGWGGEGPIMQGFDIAIAYADTTGAHVEDNFANDAAGHVADTSLGGKADLLEAAVRESADKTVLEIRRKLVTGDAEHDRPFQPGAMPVLLGYADADDFMAYHESHRATAQLDFLGAAAARRRLVPEHLTEYHIGLLAWVLVLGVYGIIGLASVWLEGVEPLPERVEPRPGTGAVVALTVVAVAALAGSVWFIVQVVAGTSDGRTLGLSGTFWMWTLAMAVALYRRYFMVAETIQQDRDEEIPW